MVQIFLYLPTEIVRNGHVASTLVIIPAYNEDACIVDTVHELQDVAPEFDYIIINDGSKDR